MGGEAVPEARAESTICMRHGENTVPQGNTCPAQDGWCTTRRETPRLWVSGTDLTSSKTTDRLTVMETHTLLGPTAV